MAKIYGALEVAQLEWFTQSPDTRPSAATNTYRVIWVSDLQQVQVSNGTSWVAVGTKAGSKNYLSQNNANPDFENNSVSPWSVCTLTFSGGAPTGAPTLSATQMTIASTATTPLAGSYSMLLTKAAANAQYQGFISAPLTIDREDVAKVLYGSFSYEVISGTVDFSGTSTQTYEIWIYNTVSGAWIQPAGYRGMNQSSGTGKVVFSFQTDGTFANNSYRIAVITQQTGAGAIVVEFDDFELGPSAIVTGAVMTDWQSYTPTVTYNTGGATNVTHYGKYRRVGDSVEILVSSVFSNTSAAFTRPIYSLPAGLVIDTAKLLNSNYGAMTDGAVGFARANNSATNAYPGTAAYNSTTSFFAHAFNASTADVSYSELSNTVPFTFNVGDSIEVHVKVPIAGWSSTVQVSSDTDTRVVACKASTSGIQSVPTFTWTKCTSLTASIIDTHGAFVSGSQRIVFPVSGFYTVFCSATFAANGTGSRAVGFTINNAAIPSEGGAGQNGSAVDLLASTYQSIISVKAGDYIELGVYQSSGGNLNLTGGFLMVQRISGPSAITATETVAARYYTGAAPSISNGTIVNFVTKDYDTHNAVTTGASWKFTAPVSGKYSIKAILSTSVSVTPMDRWFLMVYKNGALDQYIGVARAWSTTTAVLNPFGSCEINLNAGDYIDLRVDSTTGAALLTASIQTNWISIVRVGN